MSMRKTINRYRDMVKVAWASMGRKYVIVEHPKCGRTWLLQILMYILEKTDDCHELDRFMRTHDGSGIQTSDQLSHQDMLKRNIPWWIRRKRIVLLLRDPRDVMVSFYFQATKRRGAFKGEISEFVRSPLFGIERFVAFYDNYLSYLDDFVEGRDYIIITYEDLRTACSAQITKLVHFIDLQCDNEVIDEAIQYCSFDNMQKREIDNSEKKRESYGALSPGDIKDPESFKARRGKVGGYVDYLANDDIAFMETQIGNSRFLSRYYNV